MDLETRVALLEASAKQRHEDNVELRFAIAELTDQVKELNTWQASMKYPLTALGVIFMGILSSAGYGIWSLFTSGSQ